MVRRVPWRACTPCDVVCAPGIDPEGEPDCGYPLDTVDGGSPRERLCFGR